jgi:hypothetical protein
MRNLNLVLDRFKSRHARLGVARIAREAGVRAQHVCDVAHGRRAPNVKLAAWLGFEPGWLPRRRPNWDAPAPPIEPPRSTATDSAPAQTPQPEA